MFFDAFVSPLKSIKLGGGGECGPFVGLGHALNR